MPEKYPRTSQRGHHLYRGSTFTCRRILLVAGLLLLFAAGAFAQILTHGPVVGGVTDTTANVFVRTDMVADVILQYSTDPTFATFSSSSTFTTDPSSDFTEIIPLTGLTAETPYYLNVTVNGTSQLSAPFPTFTTFAPAGSPRDFKFVVLTDFVTCSTLNKTTSTFDSASTEAPAFVFIGGDFDHSDPMTIDDKRNMFHVLYDPTTPFMSSFVPDILLKYPIIHQWDDHDSGVNNLDRTYPLWLTNQQVYQENVPCYPLPSVTPGIWQKFSYAQLDGFVLDCRSQRDPETDADDVNKSMLDGNNLGATGQFQWLENGLLASTATWKVIFTSVVTNTTTKYPDAWAGYQTEFTALRTFINSNNIKNVVFIAGDLHLAAIDDGSISGFPEMCVPMANAEKTGYCASGALGTWSEGYYDTTCSGYGRVTVAQNPDTLTLEDADEHGNPVLSYAVTGATPTPTPTPVPSITRQPRKTTVNVGDTANFSVRASGDFPLTYQWLKNGVALSGDTDTACAFANTTSADNGALFSVVVTNPGGSVTSNTAKLTVNFAPIIVTQPQNITVKIGKKAKFTVTAMGTAPVTYQWQENGANITGATKSTYTTPATTAADSGEIFDVIITNSFGSTTSNNAVLTTQ